MDKTAEKINHILEELSRQGSQLSEIFSAKNVSDFTATDWQKINKGL